jgi:large conductance mechanosensitive channel
MKDFINFIKKQGVLGFAVGLILGGAVSNFVSAIVRDLIDPILGTVLGSANGLKSAILVLGPVQLLIGDLLSTFIDFIVIALVVYYAVRLLKLENSDKK